jgi:hypothetical protein
MPPRATANPSPRRWSLLLLAGLTAWLAGCAVPTGLRSLDSAAAAPQPRFGLLRLAGQDIETEWHLPSSGGTTPGATAGPAAWLLLQHGFARRCANLRHLAAQLAREAGVATLCLNAEMGGGSPALADALAHWLASDEAQAPDGRGAPPRLIVGGFSAGGAFAARVGQGLAAPGGAPDRLAGALLFDPVGGASMGRALVAVSAGGQRPVRALMAPPVRCNAMQVGVRALRAVRAAGLPEREPAFLGVVFTAGTHVDAEGPDTEALAVRACRDGWPRPAVVQALRDLATDWTRQMLQPDPGPESRARTLARQRLDGRVDWTEID